MQPSVLRDARSLLGRLVVGHGVVVRVTEVEAYAGPLDPASHAFRRTPRSEIMYGPPGRLYVYRIHGHHCANVVTGDDGTASAVLMRAGEVVEGLETARLRRPAARSDIDLARGPGRLAAALGITMADNGVGLDGPPPPPGGSGIRLAAGPELSPRLQVPIPPAPSPRQISAGPRVGVRRAADRPWRFWVTGDPTVSAYRRHPRAET